MKNAIEILYHTARQHYWNGVGPLSIKLFPVGRAFYRSGRAAFAVDQQSYLVLNQGQSYTITIDAATPVTSFCLFFRDGFAEEVRRSLSAHPDSMLTDPYRLSRERVNFYERTYRHDDLVTPALFNVYNAYAEHKDDIVWLEEQAHRVMQRLLRAHNGVRSEVAALPALRPATRDELYRRLHRARDYAAALFHHPVTLHELAQVADLSPTYFLRSFKQLFHQTPHDYLTTLRLEEAKRLLHGSELSVTEICFDVGFASLGSFSSLFRQRVGCSPSMYRQKRSFSRSATNSDDVYSSL